MPWPFTPFRSISLSSGEPGCPHCNGTGVERYTGHEQPCPVCRLRKTQARNVRCGMPDDATTATLRRLNEDMERWIAELHQLLED